MKNLKKSVLAINFVLILTFGIVLMAPTAAAIPERQTHAFLSVNPYTLGLGQTLLVNAWTFPSPATRSFSWSGIGFHDVVVTFTKPDGSTDSFKPIHGSGALAPGVTETLGAIWFHYVPDQIGTWTVSYTQPQQVIGPPPDDDISYPSATSQVVTFTVQQDKVQIGETPRALPGPNEYWDRPISAEHREWHVLGGIWNGRRANPISHGNINLYSTAPKTPHILWKTPITDGGLVGGEWGSISYPAGSFGGGGWTVYMINGKVYYNSGSGMFSARDLTTGELIYKAPGSISQAQIIRSATRSTILAETESGLTREYLWKLSGSTWYRYDAFTGSVTMTINNVPSGCRGAVVYGDLIYTLRQGAWNNTIFLRRDFSRILKLDLTKSGSDFADKIVWNVTLKNADGTGPGEGNRGSSLSLTADGTVAQVLTAGEDMFYGYDTTTGLRIYTKNIGHMYMIYAAHLGPNDTVLSPETEAWPSLYHSYDLKTGEENWAAVFDDYPWGVNTRPYGYGYGLVYFMGYDGHVTAVDEDTGLDVWKFYTGDTTETPYGTWVPFLGPAIADEVYFIGTSEHTPTQPRVRGAKMFALDAITGDEIWRINDGLQPNGIADGILLASSEYSGMGYAFGKGKTETTVESPLTAVPSGAEVMIRGTVLDMSPAQPGTPAISDSDMGPWMEYLHQQKLMPMNINGVAVKLTAIDPNGNYQDIGTVTSDFAGTFGLSWLPPVPGTYFIMAEFEGSESYWPSMATSYFEVGDSSSFAGQMEPELTTPTLTEAPFITTEIAIILAVAVAVVIGTAATWALKKRK